MTCRCIREATYLEACEECLAVSRERVKHIIGPHTLTAPTSSGKTALAIAQARAQAFEEAARIADDVAGDYPEDVFPPKPTTIDGASGNMGRHTANRIATAIRARAAAVVKGDGG